MHLNSINKTIDKFKERNTILAPARLHGYKRAWSAITLNRIGAKTKDGIVPEYISFLNLEKASDGSVALGVFFQF